MKTLFCVWLVVLILIGIPFSVLAEEQVEEAVKVMETVVSQLKDLLNADNVFGTPLEFNGSTVIPIVGYGFGFGAGSGSGSTKLEAGSGSGGGAGGGVMPTSLLVIGKDGSVEVLSAQKGVVSDIVSSLAPLLLEAIKSQQNPKTMPEAGNAPVKK